MKEEKQRYLLCCDDLDKEAWTIYSAQRNEQNGVTIKKSSLNAIFPFGLKSMFDFILCGNDIEGWNVYVWSETLEFFRNPITPTPYYKLQQLN